MSDTLYVRIKKDYAAAIIKDLQKLDAVELLEEAPIPEWQRKEVKKRLKDLEGKAGKEQILTNIKKGLKEVQQFKQGKLKTTSAQDFLNEL